MPVYSPEIASEICERLAIGESLRTICSSDPSKFPTETAVRKWATEDVNGFSSHYASAREKGLDAMADLCLQISDEAQLAETSEQIQAARLRVDTRKWYLSKLAPKRYGDRIEQRITDGDGGPLTITVRRHDKADK